VTTNTLSHAETLRRGVTPGLLRVPAARRDTSFYTKYPEVFVTSGIEQPVWSPEDLRKHDPKPVAILAKVYPDHRIRPMCIVARSWADLPA
jgi:hypothetical protein